jgi:2-oxo-4-hydroxy-4-carboxy-5-ureidoimidazoline decarboxylase
VSVVDVVQTLDDGALRQRLLTCCGSTRWADAVAARRPFADGDALLAAAAAALDDLTDEDWREALCGEPAPAIHDADPGTRAAAETAVRLYRQHFGYSFVVAASRIPGEELLMRVRIRLGNDAVTELQAAAAELRRIVDARLRRLLEEYGAQPA